MIFSIDKVIKSPVMTKPEVISSAASDAEDLDVRQYGRRAMPLCQGGPVLLSNDVRNNLKR